MADWLLERIERGHFADPSEAVFAIVQNFIEMEPHRDLRTSCYADKARLQP
jgi:antitoxin ParD1/3/4